MDNRNGLYLRIDGISFDDDSETPYRRVTIEIEQVQIQFICKNPEIIRLETVKAQMWNFFRELCRMKTEDVYECFGCWNPYTLPHQVAIDKWKAWDRKKKAKKMTKKQIEEALGYPVEIIEE